MSTKADANFASSPRRVLIDALDPVYICKKVALTSIKKVIAPQEVVDASFTGVEGIGGLQTRRKCREGFPLETYSS